MSGRVKNKPATKSLAGRKRQVNAFHGKPKKNVALEKSDSVG